MRVYIGSALLGRMQELNILRTNNFTNAPNMKSPNASHRK